MITALALSGCAAPRQVEERAVYDRRDTLRAVFGEELTVCLDDFRIVAPDSRPSIEAARVRVERRRESTVTAAEEVEAVDERRVEESPRSIKGSGWLYGLVGAVCFLLGLKVGINR